MDQYMALMVFRARIVIFSDFIKLPPDGHTDTRTDAWKYGRTDIGTYGQTLL